MAQAQVKTQAQDKTLSVIEFYRQIEYMKELLEVRWSSEYKNIGVVSVRFEIERKPANIYVRDDNTSNCDDSDPSLLCFIEFALQKLIEGRRRILDMLMDLIGIRVKAYTSSHPCEGGYEDRLSNVEITDVILLRKYERMVRYRGYFGGYREEWLYGIMTINNVTVIYRMYYDHSWDINNSSTRYELTLLPLASVKLRVIREIESVTCGPDGGVSEYTTTRILEFRVW